MARQVKLLFIGDIIGKLGRQVCGQVLPELRQTLQPDFIIANGENAAHGYGLTEKVYQELMCLGIDALTMGNHVWDKKELVQNIEKLPRVVRPANYPVGTPGPEYLILEKADVKLAIVNLSGRTFMQCMDCPFQAMQRLLPQIKTNLILVDIHAEATSEKVAMGWFLDGNVSAVLGTHTHVMTADERLLPNGTAYLSDAGMVGAYDSIIGMQKEQILKRFVTQIPEKFEPTESGPGLFNAVLVSIDAISGHAKEIKKIVKVVPAA
jgi:hypothetical protein